MIVHVLAMYLIFEEFLTISSKEFATSAAAAGFDELKGEGSLLSCSSASNDVCFVSNERGMAFCIA